MKSLLVSLCIFGLVVVPALGDADDCYFGITQDGDDDPEEDWDGVTCNNEQDQGCRGVTCRGSYAMCIKVRFEGDEDTFVSMYGCVNDRYAPTDPGSWIPFGYSVDDLALDNLPDPWDADADACASEDELAAADLPALPFYLDQLTPDDDGNVKGEWCACVEEGCNGATANVVGVVSIVASVVMAKLL